MSVWWRRSPGLLALALLGVAAQVARGPLAVDIGVVEGIPVRAQEVAAAVEVGLQAAAGLAAVEGSVRVAGAEPGEPLAVPLQVCLLAEPGRAALVAGGSDEVGGARRGAAAAARAGLPLLLLDPAPADASWEALQMYPHEDVLIEVGRALIAAKEWRSAVVLHEGTPHAVTSLAPDDDDGVTLVPRKLPPPQEDALLRNLLLVLKKSGAVNFVVWSGAEAARRVLAAAQRVGLLDQRHAYLLLTLDLHTQPLDAFSHGGANLTTLRLFDPESVAIRNMSAKWVSAYTARLGEAAAAEAAAVEATARALPTALVLAHDAARFAATALAALDLPPAEGDADACATGAAALHADTLLNYLRSKEWYEGLSGPALWAADGARRDAVLEVAEVERGGQVRGVGRWSGGELEWTRPPRPAPPRPSHSMVNRTFTVLIAKNNPYIMSQESVERLSGNERYEGFGIELLQRLSELLQFNYTLVEQADGDYGTRDNRTGQWSGMINRLMNDPNIDFAITDLTITAEREQAVDFTTPFMNLGISILFRKPKPPEPKIFAFLLPFSSGVWVCLGFAYLLTSLLLYTVGRLCPEEWQNPYPCVEEPVALQNQFTLANALWFNLGAVLLQGSEIAPVAYGTRAVASVWWLFALVITSSYTANLATLLAKKTSNELISNVEELADNPHGITYGAKAGGSTFTFFEQSQNPLYRRMYEKMKTQQMPTSNDKGINKVLTDNYAFFAESTTIEYTIERNCQVTKVGGLLDNKGYGIAMKKSSPYRQALNLALLNLQEGGVLREMKDRWWHEKHGGGACKETEDRSSEKLYMNNFLGLFAVLCVGSVSGVVLSFVELSVSAWRRHRAHVREEGAASHPFRRRLLAELRFVFQFGRSVKPVTTPPLTPTPSPPAAGSPSPAAGSPSPPGGSQPDTPLATRTPSLRSRRRRSSMHAASIRLARHAHTEH